MQRRESDEAWPWLRRGGVSGAAIMGAGLAPLQAANAASKGNQTASTIRRSPKSGTANAREFVPRPLDRAPPCPTPRCARVATGNRLHFVEFAGARNR